MGWETPVMIKNKWIMFLFFRARAVSIAIRYGRLQHFSATRFQRVHARFTRTHTHKEESCRPLRRERAPRNKLMDRAHRGGRGQGDRPNEYSITCRRRAYKNDTVSARALGQQPV